MSTFTIRPINGADRLWLRDFMVEHWGSSQMVYSKGVHQLDELPGFTAFLDDEPAGLLTMRCMAMNARSSPSTPSERASASVPPCSAPWRTWPGSRGGAASG